MSWRAESTFKASSALADAEKEFLKLVKKVRDILKLEEKEKNGEKLQQSQISKIGELEQTLKELSVMGGRLPATTEVLARNEDIVKMLPQKARDNIMKNQYEAKDKAKHDEQRMQRKDQQIREERNKPEFMTRHDRPILGIAVSKDGYIFTCSKDKYVLGWSMDSTLLTVCATFAGHRGAVRAVDCSPSHGLVSGDSDGKIMLWDKLACKRKGSVAAPVSTITDGGNLQVLRWCPFDKLEKPGDPQRLASACEKLASKPAAIAVWSVSGRNVTAVLRMEDLPGKANDLRWAGGAKTKLISAHDNGYVGIWLAEGAGSLLKTMKLHSAPITSLCLSPDGKALITASEDSSSKVVDVSTPATETIATYKADRPLRAVDVTPDFVAGQAGQVIVAGGRDPMKVALSAIIEDEFETKVLDWESGVPVASTKGHFGPVHDVVYMPWADKGSGGFATCSEDGCLVVHALDGRTLHSDRVGDA